MNLVLDRKEYLVGVTIYEARNISGKDSQGTSDPFLKVRCADQVQQTQKKFEQNSAVWNQSLTFKSVVMNQYELETFELILELYDHNPIRTNELIGQYSIGLSTLYRALNHEFFKMWVGLFHPDDHNKFVGYLQISCFIVGPNERPPVHASEDEVPDVDAMDYEEEDEEEIAKRIESIKRAQGVVLVNTANIINKTYQLSAVIMKAEGLPNFNGEVNPFISMRVNGCVLTTKTQTKNANPQFYNRLQFPITYPILNDKITSRIWSKTDGLSPNIFIANIPEHPQEGDFFNLSKLQSSDGRMPARWINLYGVPPKERSAKTKSLREGTAFLGRILLAMNLSSNDYPALATTSSGPLKEPRQSNYQLWVDLYEWINCDFAKTGTTLEVQVTIGSEKTSTMKQARLNKETKQYYFKDKQVETLMLNFPTDISQVPDVIINFFAKSSAYDESRIGYLRICAADVAFKSPKPQWLRIKSPFNDQSSKHPGQILMNCQLIRYNPNVEIPERILKQRSGKQNYMFYYQIISGFELAGAIPQERLKPVVKIQLGSNGEKPIVSKVGEGRYPLWRMDGFKEIQMERELGLESDMKLSVFNKDGSSEFLIGECSVPVDKSLTNLCDRPQFFNMINEEGMFVGQVLANFHLKHFLVDPRKPIKQQSIEENPEHIEIKNHFEEALQLMDYPVQISFSLVGIRNLVKPAIKPVVKIRLTNAEKGDFHVFKMEAKEDGRDASFHEHSPNFGDVKYFKEVKLPKEPLAWPFLEICVYDETDERNALTLVKKGCETCYTTICLIPYADDTILDPISLKYAMLQLQRNQDQLSYVQPQLATETYMERLGLNFKALVGIEDGDDLSGSGKAVDETHAFAVKDLGRNFQETVHKKTTIRNLTNRQTKMFDFIGLIENGVGETNRTLDPEEIDLQMNGTLRRNEGQFQFDNVDEEEDEEVSLVKNNEERNINIEMGIICNPAYAEHIEVNRKDKEMEERDREQTKAEFMEEIRELTIQLNTLGEEQIDEKRVFQMKIMELQDQIANMEEEKMTEQKFWGMAGINEDEEFDYGRDVVRDGSYDRQLILPYREMALFTNAEWFQNFSDTDLISVSGILRSGKLSGASIKASIKIILQEEIIAPNQADYKNSIHNPNQRDEDLNHAQATGSQNEEDPFQFRIQKAQKHDDETLNDLLNIHVNSGDKNQKVKDLMEGTAELVPFDLSDKYFMRYLMADMQKNFKVRVYIISGQNLSAMNSVIDLKSKWAGMNALCTANPYVVIKIGSQDPKDPKKQKGIKDREKAFQGELNPEFLSPYEFDVEFPQDQKLEIAIYDKQNRPYSDQLIGKTTIDLEDRRNSDLLNINRMALQVENEQYKKTLKFLNQRNKLFSVGEVEQMKQYLQERKNQHQKLAQALKMVDQIMVPIEFRELMHPNKQQVQGILECWTEIITQEDSRKIPFSKMKKQQAQLYEIRVVIWETRNIPLTDGDKVDMFIKCTYDPTGWSEDEVTKSTDTHMNSKDGKGVFNYRMKFDLKIPCEFPRLKFQVFDSGVMQDEAIGETTMSLKNTLKKLKKEGSVSVPKSFVTFINPTDPDEERGMMLFSLDILLKEDAKQDPVGEAWDEPNKNPFLKKPTVGRGLGDALAAIGVSAPTISFNPFGKFLPFVIAGFVIATLLTIKVMFL